MAKSGDLTPEIASASTNGRPVAVAATASPGTTIHTAGSGTDTIDYVTVYAVNIDSSSHPLTLEWGGTSTSDRLGPVTLTANSGLVLIAEALPIQNGLGVKAYSDSANKINVVVRVARGVI